MGQKQSCFQGRPLGVRETEAGVGGDQMGRISIHEAEGEARKAEDEVQLDLQLAPVHATYTSSFVFCRSKHKPTCSVSYLTHCYAMFLVNRHTQEAGSNLMLMSDCIAILLISTSQAKLRMSGMLWSGGTSLAASRFHHVEHPV